MKLSNDYISYEIDGEKILVCMDSNKFAGVVKLNKTADFIVEQLKTGCTKETLIHAVTEHFSEVDSAKAGKDIDSLVTALRSVGAIED